MIDPISTFALATAAFNGIKKAVELGREVEDVYQQLSQWAGHVSDLREIIQQTENRKPGLWEKIGFDKSETSEAFDIFIAKKKLEEWEKELYNEFLYGGLQHLGMDGYREFIQMRREIKAKREKMIYDQARRRQEFVRVLKESIIIAIVLGLSIALLWWMIDLIFTAGQAAGRW
jgi:hypothetical protein